MAKRSENQPTLIDDLVCAHCGKAGQPGDIIPIGTSRAGHAWLHDFCWPSWFAKTHSGKDVT